MKTLAVKSTANAAFAALDIATIAVAGPLLVAAAPLLAAGWVGGLALGGARRMNTARHAGRCHIRAWRHARLAAETAAAAVAAAAAREAAVQKCTDVSFEPPAHCPA